MRLGISEAKQRFCELVELASQGEEIVITRRGKQLARLVGTTGVQSKRSVQEIFDSFARIRMKQPKGATVKEMIEAGRRF